MKEKKDQTTEIKVKYQFSRVRVRLFALWKTLAWPTSSMGPGDDTTYRPYRAVLLYLPHVL